MGKFDKWPFTEKNNPFDEKNNPFEMDGQKKASVVCGVQIFTDRIIVGISNSIVTFEDGTHVDVSQAPHCDLPGVKLKGNFDRNGVSISDVRSSGDLIISSSRRSIATSGPTPNIFRKPEKPRGHRSKNITIDSSSESAENSDKPPTLKGVEIHTDKKIFSVHALVVTFEDGTHVDVSQAPHCDVPGVELRGKFNPDEKMVYGIQAGGVTMSGNRVGGEIHVGPKKWSPSTQNTERANEVSGVRVLIKRWLGL